MFLADQVKDLEAINKELKLINEAHRAENGKLREVVRQQGEFIQSLKEMIADFVYGPDATSLGVRRVSA